MVPHDSQGASLAQAAISIRMRSDLPDRRNQEGVPLLDTVENMRALSIVSGVSSVEATRDPQAVCLTCRIWKLD